MKYFQFHGIESSLFNVDTLRKAIRMEDAGVSPKEIWEKLGLFKDIDNRWKAEDNDDSNLGAKLKPDWIERIKSNNANLYDILDYPSLFKYSPRATEIDVGILTSSSSSGSYNEINKRILINASLLDNSYKEYVESIIEHELGHHLQRKYEFSRGFDSSQESYVKLINHIEGVLANRSNKLNTWDKTNALALLKKQHCSEELQYARLFYNSKKFIEYGLHHSKPTAVLSKIKELSGVIHSELFNENGIMDEQTNQFALAWYNLPKSDYKHKKTEYLRELCSQGANLMVSKIPNKFYDYLESLDFPPNQILSIYQNKYIDSVNALVGREAIEKEVLHLKGYLDTIKGLTPEQVYNRIGGEVASRAIENRMLLTPKERKAKFPMDSYDVAPNDILPLIGENLISIYDPSLIAYKDYSLALPNASIEFRAGAFAKILLNPTADMSSLVHESGHYYLEVFSELYLYPDAKSSFKKDFEDILAWFGVTTQQWYSLSEEEKEPYHEKFAESFEHYLLNNNSDSRNIFRKVRTWLYQIYHAMHSDTLTSSDSISHVFSNMLNQKATKKSPISDDIYNIISDEFDTDSADAIKAIHSITTGYFSKQSGLTPSRFSNDFDINIELGLEKWSSKCAFAL